MTVIDAPATGRSTSPRWPALAAAWYIGIFCLVTSNVVLWTFFQGKTLTDNGVVVLAIVLRLVTVLLAVASIAGWGRFVPGWLLLAGLWGAAAVQLAYPIAETVVKALILTGVMEPINKGISNMSAEGWFNFGATWLIWGVPGLLFVFAARAYARRVHVDKRWVVLGILGGLGLLLGLGVIIG
ncbi:hypothetical protein [Actinoplanes friuliensis]|uniref:Uncharacterized protein n=1 Tax=Actinoplanes friuliensis DSM 7358 TaxID=1246995 RepID=U5VNB0_9ACTN|nr:hypothetical protein [Actinoplanes friuliensis]AGZ38458.1 hypothetical protein AFR_00845 [Actinoplanes friuliensis DSM 7358]